MYKKTLFAGLLLSSTILAAGSGLALASEQIRIVGSSTVFPFATTDAERFGKNTDFKTPVVESTGSGGGMKLFCSGVGMEHPDITNASRRIKSREYKKCTENGITITEVKVGYDGIVLGNAKSGPDFFLTTKDIFLALAKDIPDGKGGLIANPHKTWADVNKNLPTTKIEVLGPLQPLARSMHSWSWRWKKERSSSHTSKR